MFTQIILTLVSSEILCGISNNDFERIVCTPTPFMSRDMEMVYITALEYNPLPKLKLLKIYYNYADLDLCKISLSGHICTPGLAHLFTCVPVKRNPGNILTFEYNNQKINL